jgi:nitrous-oxide reductase
MHKLHQQVLIKDKSVKMFKIEENQHPYVAKGEKETKVVEKAIKFMFI